MQCVYFFPLQAKSASSTREWTEQETLLLLEVSYKDKPVKTQLRLIHVHHNFLPCSFSFLFMPYPFSRL